MLNSFDGTVELNGNPLSCRLLNIVEWFASYSRGKKFETFERATISELWCENNINQTELMSFRGERMEKTKFPDFLPKLNIQLIHGKSFTFCTRHWTLSKEMLSESFAPSSKIVYLTVSEAWRVPRMRVESDTWWKRGRKSSVSSTNNHSNHSSARHTAVNIFQHSLRNDDEMRRRGWENVFSCRQIRIQIAAVTYFPH